MSKKRNKNTNATKTSEEANPPVEAPVEPSESVSVDTGTNGLPVDENVSEVITEPLKGTGEVDGDVTEPEGDETVADVASEDVTGDETPSEEVVEDENVSEDVKDDETPVEEPVAEVVDPAPDVVEDPVVVDETVGMEAVSAKRKSSTVVVETRTKKTPVKDPNREKARELLGLDVSGLSDATCKAVAEGGSAPRKVPGTQEFMEDTRRMKNLNKLSMRFLKAYFSNLIPKDYFDPEGDEYQAVMDRARTVARLTPTLVDEAVIRFFVKDQLPQVDDRKVLLEDGTLTTAPVDYLTSNQLRAIAMSDDILANREESKDEMFEIICNRHAIDDLPEGGFAKLPPYESPLTMTTGIALKTYEDIMSKNPAKEQRVQQHIALYKKIRQILNMEYEEFHSSWNELMAMVRKNYNGCFAPEHRFREWDQIPAGNNLHQMESVLTLVIEAVRPSYVRKMPVEMLSDILGEKGAENVSIYYSR